MPEGRLSRELLAVVVPRRFERTAGNTLRDPGVTIVGVRPGNSAFPCPIRRQPSRSRVRFRAQSTKEGPAHSSYCAAILRRIRLHYSPPLVFADERRGLLALLTGSLFSTAI